MDATLCRLYRVLNMIGEQRELMPPEHATECRGDRDPLA
jgi:hypothetical protein